MGAETEIAWTDQPSIGVDFPVAAVAKPSAIFRNGSKFRMRGVVLEMMSDHPALAAVALAALADAAGSGPNLAAPRLVPGQLPSASPIWRDAALPCVVGRSACRSIPSSFTDEVSRLFGVMDPDSGRLQAELPSSLPASTHSFARLIRHHGSFSHLGGE